MSTICLPADRFSFFSAIDGEDKEELGVFELVNATYKILTYPHEWLPAPLYLCFMEVNDVMVNKLATLSRLHFDESGKESIKNDLQKMIAFVEKLNELDTTGIAPLLHMSDNINVLKEDASKHDETFFKVPKVISKK